MVLRNALLRGDSTLKGSPRAEQEEYESHWAHALGTFAGLRTARQCKVCQFEGARAFREREQ